MFRHDVCVQIDRVELAGDSIRASDAGQTARELMIRADHKTQGTMRSRVQGVGSPLMQSTDAGSERCNARVQDWRGIVRYELLAAN